MCSSDLCRPAMEGQQSDGGDDADRRGAGRRCSSASRHYQRDDGHKRRADHWPAVGECRPRVGPPRPFAVAFRLGQQLGVLLGQPVNDERHQYCDSQGARWQAGSGSRHDRCGNDRAVDAGCAAASGAPGISDWRRHLRSVAFRPLFCPHSCPRRQRSSAAAGNANCSSPIPAGKHPLTPRRGPPGRRTHLPADRGKGDDR